MIAYLDSSILIRLVLREPKWLREIAAIEKAVSSTLIRVDCHRGLDALWHSGELDDRSLAQARREVEKFLDVVELRDVDDQALELATQPLESPLSSAGAVHLATAMLYTISSGGLNIVFATHDELLATIARNHFPVIGI